MGTSHSSLTNHFNIDGDKDAFGREYEPASRICSWCWPLWPVERATATWSRRVWPVRGGRRWRSGARPPWPPPAPLSPRPFLAAVSWRPATIHQFSNVITWKKAIPSTSWLLQFQSPWTLQHQISLRYSINRNVETKDEMLHGGHALTMYWVKASVSLSIMATAAPIASYSGGRSGRMLPSRDSNCFLPNVIWPTMVDRPQP